MYYHSNEWMSWLKVIFVALLIAIGIRTFFFTPIVVDGASMQPTLHNGDRIIVNKFSYTLSEPERFDVVVFHASKSENYIKRIVGLPGEHISYKDEVLYVNGEPVKEPFLNERLKALQPPSHYTHDFRLEDLPGKYRVIPEGYVLVLGDNRTNSTDSRKLGLVSLEQILGKAQFVYWPLQDFGFVK